MVMDSRVPVSLIWKVIELVHASVEQENELPTIEREVFFVTKIRMWKKLFS